MLIFNLQSLHHQGEHPYWTQTSPNQSPFHWVHLFQLQRWQKPTQSREMPKSLIFRDATMAARKQNFIYWSPPYSPKKMQKSKQFHRMRNFPIWSVDKKFIWGFTSYSKLKFHLGFNLFSRSLLKKKKTKDKLQINEESFIVLILLE